MFIEHIEHQIYIIIETHTDIIQEVMNIVYILLEGATLSRRNRFTLGLKTPILLGNTHSGRAFHALPVRTINFRG